MISNRYDGKRVHIILINGGAECGLDLPNDLLDVLEVLRLGLGTRREEISELDIFAADCYGGTMRLGVLFCRFICIGGHGSGGNTMLDGAPLKLDGLGKDSFSRL